MSTAAQILIVEDSETQALLLCALLEEEGWEVTRAATAEAALEELDRHLPTLMIVDYHLPGIQGDELCRRVRMRVNMRSIPILMLTAEAGYDTELTGLDSGADDYVSKSVAAPILMLRVRTLLRTAGARSSLPSAAENVSRRTQILAIDDSPTYLESLTEALRQEGYAVTPARDGHAGLELLSQTTFDCVVVDLIMPEIDGIEVCSRIFQRSYPQDPPIVIILTSREGKDDMTRGLEAGADDFVGKSSDVTVLKARVRALLRRRSFQEENRQIREELARREMEAVEARVARELAEAKAALAEQLERKNKELEVFSYSVSHDLRGPLQVIDGFSAILLDEYHAVLDEKGQRYLSNIREAAQRMDHLITDLLELSRIERTGLQRGLADLSALARAVSTELQAAAPRRRVRVLIPETVVADGDPGLLRIVLANLLGNAWKFTSRRAEAVIEFGVVEKAGECTYFVRDNGAGFDIAYAENLFTPFERLHQEAEFPGTGIGLATVRRIVERHGGRIWGEAVVDQGATFSWTLPSPSPGNLT
jgi:two-component system NtrC family sensor kinase